MSAGTDEINRYNVAEPQNLLNNKPNTLASASTVVPTHKLTFITGTTAIATITPPMPGMHVLYFIFTNANPAAFTGAGNVTGTYDPQQNVVTTLVYDPSTAKYYTGAVT